MNNQELIILLETLTKYGVVDYKDANVELHIEVRPIVCVPAEQPKQDLTDDDYMFASV